MSKEEMNKYAYELMIKNNPDEVIKNLILLERLQQRIDKAIEYIHHSLNNPLCDEREALKYLLDILKGNKNES